jgi:hypothetical protein
VASARSLLMQPFRKIQLRFYAIGAFSADATVQQNFDIPN